MAAVSPLPNVAQFVEFYVCTLEALAAEEVARRAFDRFDVDGSNSLEKHELFQVRSGFQIFFLSFHTLLATHPRDVHICTR